MIKKIIYTLICILFTTKYVDAATKDLVCMYYKSGSAIMLFQHTSHGEFGYSGVRYISYKEGDRPLVNDELWHHYVDPALYIDYTQAPDSLAPGGRSLDKCPQYAGIDEVYEKAIFSDTSYCERCSMSEQVYINYELYYNEPKSLDELLNEPTTTPIVSPNLTCSYLGELGIITILQDTNGNLTAKIAFDMNYSKTCYNSLPITLPRDSAAIDLDKYGNNGDILTASGHLRVCPERVAYYKDSFGIHHFEMNVGTYFSKNASNISMCNYNVEAPNISNCKTLLGDPEIEKTPAWFIVYAFDVLKYVAIILLIVLSIMDFVTAASSGDSDKIKNTTFKVFKRLILCVLIFLLPSLLKVLLTFLNDTQADLCGIK